MVDLKHGSRIYQIGKIVVKEKEDGKYRLYICTEDEADRQCLMQIATTVEYNGELDRAAYILGDLKSRADEVEEEYSKLKTDPKDQLNYHLQFPELVDSFICPEQGGRRVNILDFRNVEQVKKMVPLIYITEKDQLRVDIRTSAWIIGKLLKLLVFAHSERYSVGMITGKNIIIEPDRHYVLIFDWSAARTHHASVPEETRRQEISQATRAVIALLGGNFETGDFPKDCDKTHVKYTDELLWLARGNESNAKKAHERIYKIIDQFWKCEYYPFTTQPY